jgi:hypothetical protein
VDESNKSDLISSLIDSVDLLPKPKSQFTKTKTQMEESGEETIN